MRATYLTYPTEPRPFFPGKHRKNINNSKTLKHRKLHVEDGDYVTKGTVLGTQIGLLYHPGLNVCNNMFTINYNENIILITR